MYKIGLSTASKEICEELFINYNRAGISAMEISTRSEDYLFLDYKEIYDLSRKYNIELWSFHLPFKPFAEIDLSNNALCKKTVSYLAELMKKAGDIGVDKFIVHSSGIVKADAPDHRERMECAKESLAILAEIVKKQQGVLAVENLPPICLGSNSDELLELISVHDNLKVCFDTNHLLKEDPLEFINKLKDKIITLHVSDYDFINERHWLPGEGKIKWQEMLKSIQDINYNGVWMYEVAFGGLKTITRSRDLTCEDFVRNAKEIFANEKLTVWGTPASGL